ncbi:MAG: glycosyltransferase family 2 protein [Hyphomicrobium sp.]
MPDQAVGRGRTVEAGASPSLAVIIPCWNSEQWIAQAISSVLRQQYPRIEVIVVDDGSTDRSGEVLQSFGDQIARISQPNHGAQRARNAGLTAATAEYVAFLDADDEHLNGSLAMVGERLRRKPCDMLLTDYIDQWSDGTQTRSGRLPPGAAMGDLVLRWARQQNIVGPAIWYRRSFLIEIGAWNEDVKVLQDYELSFRALLNQPRVECAPEPTVVYMHRMLESRISKRHDAESWTTVLNFLNNLVSHHDQKLNERHRREIAQRYYLVARKLYQAGSNENGDRALRAFRRLNGSVPELQKFDRTLIAILGLRRREQLARAKRRLIARWTNVIGHS